MDKISIEEGLKLLGYELTEADYSLVIDAARVCITSCDGDESMIDLLSDEKKNSIGFLFCTLPMDPDLSAAIISCFLRVKKLTAFI